MKPIHITREDWLLAAIAIFRTWFAEQNYQLAEMVRVSVGFPSRGALSSRNRTIGQCWGPDSSQDGSTHVFISPVIGDALRVGDVLLHELCHDVAGQKCGHRGEFKRVASAMGLTGKMTTTIAGPELAKRLNGVLKVLGTYPHAVLDPKKSPIKKQSTRLLKAKCSECGYVIRVTRKWVDQSGLPTCPCGETFIEAEPESEAESD